MSILGKLFLCFKHSMKEEKKQLGKERMMRYLLGEELEYRI